MTAGCAGAAAAAAVLRSAPAVVPSAAFATPKGGLAFFGNSPSEAVCVTRDGFVGMCQQGVTQQSVGTALELVECWRMSNCLWSKPHSERGSSEQAQFWKALLTRSIPSQTCPQLSPFFPGGGTTLYHPSPAPARSVRPMLSVGAAGTPGRVSGAGAPLQDPRDARGTGAAPHTGHCIPHPGVLGECLDGLHHTINNHSYPFY